MRRKEIIKELIRDFHAGRLPETKERALSLPLNVEKVITVVGTRRSGKTYLLLQTIGKLLKEKSKEEIVYINLEDERLELKIENADLLLQAYRELYPSKDLSRIYFFFDEIQNLDGWERFIRRIYDRVTKRIYLTGSNSKLLSSEIATALRGRTIKYELYPLSFKEFLSFKDIFISIPEDLYSTETKAVIAKAFYEYLLYGGFPEIVFLGDEKLKIKTLQEYFEVMFYRDLIERYEIKNIPVLKYFLKRVIEGITTPLSVNNIYNELKSQGYKVSKDSLYEFLDNAEAVYLIRLLKRYSLSVLKTELGAKKVYTVDNGLVNAITFKFKQDPGKLLENLMFKELTLRFDEVFFYKNKKECDFIACRDGLSAVFQISYELEDKATLKREIDGLSGVCKFLKIDTGYILNIDKKDEIIKDGIRIKMLPAWDYLLTNDT